MRVWHHVLRPESLTYTIAKAISLGDHELTVSVARPGFAGKLPNEIERRVHEIPGVTVVSRESAELPDVIERLIVQVNPRPADTLQAVGALARRARHITLISGGDRSRSAADARRIQWLEVRRLAVSLRKVDRLLYKDGYHERDLLSWLAPRNALGFDVHSQYLHDPVLFEAIHAHDWKPETVRPISANFIGSQDPAQRTLILDSIRPVAGAHGGTVHPDLKPLLWREYSDAAPDALSPDAFIRVLTDCDFTLCPRGYSLVTHRPVEALLRGSIPVLAADELDLYGFELVDGKNCMAVAPGDWPAAISRLTTFTEGELTRMRRNILDIVSRSLDYRHLAKQIRQRIGVA